MLMHSEQNNTKYNVLRKSKSWYNYKWWDEIEISTNKYKYEEREQKKQIEVIDLYWSQKK